MKKMKPGMRKRLRKLKQVARRTNGTIFQDLGASRGGRGPEPGTFGAASEVRRVILSPAETAAILAKVPR